MKCSLPFRFFRLFRLVLIWSISRRFLPVVHALSTKELDCRMRKLALEYAHSIQPFQSKTIYGHISDALEIDSNCNSTIDTVAKDNQEKIETTVTKFIRKVTADTNKSANHDDKRTRTKTLNETKTNGSSPSLPSFCRGDRYCIFVTPSTPSKVHTSNTGNEESSNENENENENTIGGETNTNLNHHDSKEGSLDNPVPTIEKAIDLSRKFQKKHKKNISSSNASRTIGTTKSKKITIAEKKTVTIVLRQGIHALQGTLKLDRRDNGLSIRGYPDEEVWISGGISLDREEDKIKWVPYRNSTTICQADLTSLLQDRSAVPKIPSLFTTDSRLIRARYPNSNPERSQWGYNSPDSLKYSFPVYDKKENGLIVIEWERPPPGGVLPTFEYMDFSIPHTNTSVPIKDDSTMHGYNLYTSGHGGVCSDVWGDNANSYWCSNASAGGGAQLDYEPVKAGQLNIPIGLTYNRSHHIGQHIDRWMGDDVTTNSNVGGYIHAWHSLQWCMYMFEIESMVPGRLKFKKGGGRQCARNWCRCDQCPGAGPWCKQNNPTIQITSTTEVDRRLISGTWLIEHVLSELDSPGEFYFNHSSKILYLYPNGTTVSTPIDTDALATGLHDNRKCTQIPNDLRFSLLESLISVREGAQNISIQSIGFRDTAATYMADWSPPSGGDWSLHRGGAIFLENAANIEIKDCIFRRLDGNAIFLTGRTRHIHIQRNLFEWLGENAIATWGDTKLYDGTEEHFPMHTVIEENVMREIGLFEKQSSAFGQAKAALTTVRKNIMFNLPRAAINFNDMLGGGDIVSNNLIFNTCRESGDHGAINTWDRQPFLTTLRYGTPNFNPVIRTISYNFIIANYNAHEAVDNDDGSSWHHVHHNVFYDSRGFKMDFGGHDSIYERNLIISYPKKIGHDCINFGAGTFYAGHGHIVRNNKCIVPHCDKALVLLNECNATKVTIGNNSYYSPNRTALYRCIDLGISLSLTQAQGRFQLDLGSKSLSTPSIDSIVMWSKQLLNSTQT